MITKEELHKLIDEADIDKLNTNFIRGVHGLTGTAEGDITLIVDYFKSCKTQTSKFDQMYNIFIGEFMSTENDNLLAKELYQKIQDKYKFSDEDMEWYKEHTKRLNNESI